MISCTLHEPDEIEVFEKSDGNFEIKHNPKRMDLESGRALMGENNY
jgi:hypothetical protein